MKNILLTGEVEKTLKRAGFKLKTKIIADPVGSEKKKAIFTTFDEWRRCDICGIFLITENIGGIFEGKVVCNNWLCLLSGLIHFKRS